MPGRDHAARLGDRSARRYVVARRALDTIETAALLEPRTAPQQPGPRPRRARAEAALDLDERVGPAGLGLDHHLRAIVDRRRRAACARNGGRDGRGRGPPR